LTFFNRDLHKEQLLGKYLDTVYAKINLDFNRVTDIDSQHKGVDLTYNNHDNIFIDEKAQLNYIGTSLPTFTFELSYLKHNKQKLGWLLDKTKITTHYFLITGICAHDKNNLSKGFTSCIVTSVDRTKLLNHLSTVGLTEHKLLDYDKYIRKETNKNNKQIIKELDSKKEGVIYFSPQLAEKPINLQLRLNYLIEIGVAKRIYPS